MTKLKRISVRYLLNYHVEQLWETLIGRFILVFEDGNEIETNYRLALYSAYSWELLKKYPNTRITKHHYTNNIAKICQLLGAVYWDIADTYNLYTPELRDNLTKMVYETINCMFNDLQERCEAFVTSIDILDFIQITQHSKLKGILDNPQPTHEYIDNCYKEILEVINNDAFLDNNSLARATRFKTVNTSQVLQCVGPRGYLTEVDSLILPTPVLRSYTKGMRTMYNVVAESRTAAKSLYFSDAQLKDAEYFARRLQLLTMGVERLHYVDCGSTEYIDWRVKPPVFENGRMTYPGDLKFIEGSYYLDPETNSLKVINIDDTHLNNKLIKKRSVLTCQHLDIAGVCAVCFGRMSDNVMPNANLGGVCSAFMNQQTSQSILSNKHLDASSIADPIHLNENGKKFFNISSDGVGFLVKAEYKKERVELIVNCEEAFGLTDIDIIKNIEDINPTRVSQINNVSFNLLNKGIIVPVAIAQKGRKPMLSVDFLKYLKTNRWKIKEDGNFIFDLTNWDFNLPIIKLPEMEYSFSQNSKQIAELIESKIKEIEDRANPESPLHTLVELFDLVNSKLNVNIALLEVIIYANMVRNASAEDYNFSRFSDNASMSVAEIILKQGRSLSTAYAYEDQAVTIANPRSFYPSNRPDNLFDVFIDPKNVIEHLNK